MSQPELEIRHLKEMKDLLSHVDPKHAPGLRRTIARLEALSSFLEQPAAEWKTEFFANWRALEEVYAVSVSDDEGVISDGNAAVARRAADRLAVLVESQLEASHAGPKGDS